MKPFHSKIEEVVQLTLDYGPKAIEYNIMRNKVLERERIIREACKRNGLDPNKYIYLNYFEADIYSRLGNIILKDVITKKKRSIRSICRYN